MSPESYPPMLLKLTLKLTTGLSTLDEPPKWLRSISIFGPFLLVKRPEPFSYKD